MIPLKRINNKFGMYLEGLRKEPYILINLIFAGVILLVFAYSGFFSPDKDNYPVVCIHEKLTGLPCISCGLSHSFSLILRGRISEACQWNSYGMQVFLFFLLQLVMRLVFSVIYLKTGFRKRILVTDISGSILLFVITFFPFIKDIINQVAFITF